MKKKNKPPERSPEIENLQAQLALAEETLRAIRSGEVDALVVSTPQGDQVFTLKGAERPYRILMEKMKEGAVTLAADDTVFYCNQGFADMLKIPLEKMIGAGISQFVSPADRAVFQELLRQGRESGSKGEVTFLASDGTAVPAHLSVNAMMLDGLSAAYLVATDITELKLAEEALQKAHDELEIKVEERTAELRESEQRYATTLASIGDAVIATDVEGRITFMNAVAEELTGWRLSEALTRPVTGVFSIINEQTRQAIEDPVARVLRHGLILGLANHTILVRKDGNEIPIDDSGAPIRYGDGKTLGAVLVFRDITGRKQTEDALARSGRRVSEILESITDGFMAIDSGWRFTYVNQRAAGNLGLKPGDLIGQNIWEKFPSIKGTDHEIYYRRAMQRHELQHFEMRGVLTDKWYDIRVYPSAEGISVFWQDITERKRVDEELRRAHDELELHVRKRTAELQEANKAFMDSEENYRELTESINDLFYAMDKNLRYTYWNKASEDLTGIQSKDAIGKSLYEIFPDVRGKKTEILYSRVLKTQRPEHFETPFELGGKKFIFEVNAYPTTIGLSVIAKDITDKKNLEAQLLRAQRMESIGTLAGGIAHDLNNMLTPMMMSLHMLKEKLKDEQSQKLLAILEKNSQRSADLIKQVLSFAKGVEGERAPLQAKNLITEVEKIAKETFPKNIEIRMDTPKDLFTISGDATQLHQVMMNLCVNARDAMPDGGTLCISAENFLLDENYARMHPGVKIGSFVIIAVSDTGIGIPSEIMDRIFEPFFTTKKFGKGTGLGLSTALAIVKSHGGFINVYSEVGRGTTFRIYLPATSAETQKGEDELELLTGQGELVLVADDENSILEITAPILKEYGYTVLTASDGAEAVALYAQNKDKIRVVLMDMMMPVMDGHASIVAIRKIDPGVKIIAVSGLAEKDKLAKIEDTRVHAFLQKPYTAGRLLKTINEVLGRKQDENFRSEKKET